MRGYLDHLYETESLQHLDVKPDNLLLVCNHVKVADFGLVKDLRDGGASLINGFTPAYAAPEVFDGQPSACSDQYSLAIVYQEMLVGERPFNGRSAAQLASQHLHCAPELLKLSPLEQFAVGKALSKDPSPRFHNCREFVERLVYRSSATMIFAEPTSKSDNGGTATHQPNRPASSSQLTDDELLLAQKHDGHTQVLVEPETKSLPALNVDFSDIGYRPTAMIGIGGIAGRVIRRVKQLLHDRHGDVASIPALQFLYLDTDVKSINELTTGDEQAALRDSETLLLPLRKTQDYRSEIVSDIRSIRRRWIYNIPRSLRTEGLRALGRVALLDHAQRVLAGLRTSIADATEAASLTASKQATGLDFRDAEPRVFVIASIVGGTGSGMVVDVGYAVRQILAELGLSDEYVCGMLAYATLRGDKRRRRAPANAYACLNELKYFGIPGNDYPGEPSLGMAGFRDDGPTFKSTYLVDLGEELSEQSLQDSLDEIANYLLLSSVSPAVALLDGCRADERTRHDRGLSLRTLGLCQLGSEDRALPSAWMDSLCAMLVRKWRGGIQAVQGDDRIKLKEVQRLFDHPESTLAVDQEIESLASAQFGKVELQADQLASFVRTMIQREIGNNFHDYLGRLISESLDQAIAERKGFKPPIMTALQTINMVLGVDDELTTDSEAIRKVSSRKLGFTRRSDS